MGLVGLGSSKGVARLVTLELGLGVGLGVWLEQGNGAPAAATAPAETRDAKPGPAIRLQPNELEANGVSTPYG